jgi:Lrp/AsnC family transcriptional regulator, leucine-responsive regulatory protein
MPISLDRSEQLILATLQADGRMSNVELAQRIGMSESPCFRRVKQLEQAGVISGYAAIVDQRRIGLDVTAFVQVTLDKRMQANTDKFLAMVEAEKHIVECHAMTGSYDYLLKVVARSIDHFSELCMQGILKYPGVSSVESSFSLKATKRSRVLPTS